MLLFPVLRKRTSSIASDFLFTLRTHTQRPPPGLRGGN